MADSIIKTNQAKLFKLMLLPVFLEGRLIHLHFFIKETVIYRQFLYMASYPSPCQKNLHLNERQSIKNGLP